MVSQTERGRSADRNTDTIQRGGQLQPSAREQELTRTERDIPKQNQTATSREQESQRVEHTGEQSRHYQRQPKVDENNRSTTDREWQVLGVNREEIKGTDYERKINSTGATALRRIKREREESQRALQRIEQEREALRQRAKDSYTELRADHQRNKERLPDNYFSVANIVKAVGEQIERIAQKAKEAYEAIAKRVTEREQKEHRDRSEFRVSIR